MKQCSNCGSNLYLTDVLHNFSGGEYIGEYTCPVCHWVWERDGSYQEDSMKKFNRGDQIIYLPKHLTDQEVFKVSGIDAFLEHPDALFGFVTTGPNNIGYYYCRFWLKHKPDELRTKANSEPTPPNQMFHYESHTLLEVEDALGIYC